jgi:hypothetical protein
VKLLDCPTDYQLDIIGVWGNDVTRVSQFVLSPGRAAVIKSHGKTVRNKYNLSNYIQFFFCTNGTKYNNSYLLQVT